MFKFLRNERGYVNDYQVFLVAIGACVLGLVLFFFALFSIPFSEDTGIIYEKELVFKENIYSLKDNSEIEGSFFLGTGEIEEEKAYKYMAKNDAGGLVQKTVPVEYAQIFYLEHENAQPYVEEYKKVVEFFFMPLTVYEYHFYLPKGSVTEEFNVDME